jgi:predicted dinucleotide-binding enzyme
MSRPLLKVSNNIYAEHLEEAGTPGYVARPIAGNDTAAKRSMMALVDELDTYPTANLL